MDKFLSALPAFVEVCQRHSFTRAAESLDMPIASLSRRIATLEAWLGVQLFTRSKRRVELTDAARVLLAGSEKIVADSRHVLEQLRWRQSQAGGRIRLLLPSSVYHTYLRDALGMFAARYPGIEMHAHFTTRWMDLTTRPFDLAVCTGPVPDTGFMAVRLLDSRIGLYAAPALFERRPLPDKPEAL
ncbi:MAG: LysR family transcriptional regulator, partial [Desulfovibrio sp.]|nr:LysR family transcriptional regulator [Desulfovibrio sp.]